MADKSLSYRFLGKDDGLGRTMTGLSKQSDVLHGSLGKLAGAFTGALAGAKAVDLLKDSIANASDLSESVSKTRVVFGSASKGVEAFAETAARKLGQSKQEALEATATFGNLFRALGIGQKPAADLSTKIVKLAGDLASFNNTDPAEALDALKSGLLGEAEPLRKYGVTLSAARVEAEAFADGLVKPVKDGAKVHTALVNVEAATARLYKAQKLHGASSIEAKKASDQLSVANAALAKATKGTVPELTAAQKAQASYNIIMKDTKTAQGDFSRTSSGLANQQRILKAEFKDASATLGTKLLPVATKVVSALSDALQPGSKFRDVLADLGQEASDFAKDAKPIFTYIGDHPDLFANLAKDAAILGATLKAKSFVSSLGLLKGLSGKKLGGFSSAMPVPVQVMNAGFGTAGGAGGGTVPTGGKGKGKGAGALTAIQGTIIGSELIQAGVDSLDAYSSRKLTDQDQAVAAVIDQQRLKHYNKYGSKDSASVEAARNAANTTDGFTYGLNKVRAYKFLQQYGDLKDPQVLSSFRYLQGTPEVQMNHAKETRGSQAAIKDLTTVGPRAPVTRGDIASLLTQGRRGDVTYNIPITVNGVTDVAKIIREAQRAARVAALGSIPPGMSRHDLT